MTKYTLQDGTTEIYVNEDQICTKIEGVTTDVLSLSNGQTLIVLKNSK